MIVELCEAINENLSAALGRAGISPLPSFGIGKRALVDAASYPRITWIPTSGNHDGQSLGKGGSINPRALRTRHVAIEAHIWAEDITACEVLANYLVATVHNSGLPGVYKTRGEAWDTESNSQSGELCVVVFEFELPFTDGLLPTVRLTQSGTEPGTAKITIGPATIFPQVSA